LAYLYLTEADYATLKDTVNAVRVDADVDGKIEVRYQLTDVIGRKDGLNMENLRGSGMIAGETSQAYEDTFTLTFVTARTVGIGAYLARLGQRVIQKQTPPIILTGYMALNKLLGRSVYTSNLQLGGPDIMYTNGVTHWTVDNDMEGVQAVLRWLSYVPISREEPLPLTVSLVDPVDRKIAYKPTKLAYDPRCFLEGVLDDTKGESKWTSGFFDRDSWQELLGGWAREVVVGRARLGGIPMGVVAVETRTVEATIPADPAVGESKENILQRAGQVWFPASAYKTSQAIKDIVAEDLPLIIFANWRGFSGGMSDMFHEVLKYGSYIVDALRAVKQPVIVYIPPYGTLRGGAWVVVDPTINEQYMEMYADDQARGGVLEPEGTVEVMFKEKDMIETMHRLDHKLVELDAELKRSLDARGQAADDTRTRIRNDIRAREKALLPLYHQAATQFADLHDTPGRMQRKGVIRAPVKWENARTYFYWRLRRRLAEVAIVKRIRSTDSQYATEDGWRAANALLSSWLQAETSTSATPSSGGRILDDDRATVEWLDNHGQ
jgi:acetyl-CoA carboxylase/biotin carboxylase 1